MTDIEMTINTLQIKLFRVVLIIQVGSSAFFRKPLGKKILMAVGARIVINNVHGIFERSSFFPVKRSTVLKIKSVEILQSCSGLMIKITGIAFRRKMTIDTVYPDTALIEKMCRFLPGIVGLGMYVT